MLDLRQNVTRWVMTVEFRFEEQPPLGPLPRGELVEMHMDPLTGENEAQSAARLAGLPASQRAALPLSALPDGWDRTGPQRPLPLRLRQEVQALPRGAGVRGSALG